MSFVFVQIRFEEKKNLCFRLLNLSRRHSIKAIKLLLGIASLPPARKGGKRGKLSLDLEGKKAKINLLPVALHHQALTLLDVQIFSTSQSF